MKRNFWVLGALAGVTLVVFGSTNVQAQTTFAANSGSWSDPLNWNNGVPVDNTWAAINDGRTLDVTSGAVVGLLDVGAGPGQIGNLNIGPGTDLTTGSGGGFRLGQAGGAVGTVTMTGGTASANGALFSGLVNGDIIIGDNGKGTWTMSDGTLTAQDEILLGGFSGIGEGTLNVSGGSVNVGRGLVVGLFGAKGTLDVSGGVITTNLDVLSSIGAGVPSTLTQSGGTINVGQHFIHGLAGPASYTQTGGDVHVNGVNGRLTVAESNTSATWDLKGGTLTSTHIFLGDFDNSHGTMTVSGGAIALTGNLNVGGAVASNAAPDRVDPDGTNGAQGQALNANGVLIVDGSAGSISVAGNLLANPADKSAFRSDPIAPGGDNSSLLRFILDSSGVSAINIGGMADLDGAVIDILDPTGYLSANPGASLTLIDATAGFGNVYTNTIAEQAGNGMGISLAPGIADAFRLNFLGNQLVLSAVPEPTSVVMLVVGVMGLWGSRRSSGC